MCLGVEFLGHCIIGRFLKKSSKMWWTEQHWVRQTWIGVPLPLLLAWDRSVAQWSSHLYNGERFSGRTLSWLRCGVTLILCCVAQASYLHFKSSRSRWTHSHRAQPPVEHSRSTRAESEWYVSAGPGFRVTKAECFCNCSPVGKLPMSPSHLLTPVACCAGWEYVTKPLEDWGDSLNSPAPVPLVYLCLHRKVVI